jgi:hypothetical protein
MKYQVGDMLVYTDQDTKQIYLAIIVRETNRVYDIHWFEDYALEHYSRYGFREYMFDNTMFWRKV